MIDNLKVGHFYSKQDLKVELNEDSLGTWRTGFFRCTNSPVSILFVDLEKAGKEQRFHFDDYYDGSTFHWDSQPQQSISVPTIQDLVTGRRTPILFARVDQKIKGATQPFVYCGRLKYNSHDETTTKPVHIRFDSLDYTDTPRAALKGIYDWSKGKVMDERVTFFAPLINKPPKQKKKIVDQEVSTASQDSEGSSKDNNTQYALVNNSLDPDSLTDTEKEAIVKLRISQGKFRKALRFRYSDRCAVTGLDVIELLVASHIKPWSESTAKERNDPDNGLLLAVHLDKLFDRHLITFDTQGRILIANSLTHKNRDKIGLNTSMKLDTLTEGNQKFLHHHMKLFKAKQRL